MPAKDQTTTPDDTVADVAGYVDDAPADVDVDPEGYVTYEVDGVTGYGVVIGQVDAAEHREAAVRVVPLPEPITVPVSALTLED